MRRRGILMARALKSELRHLSDDERDLARRSRPPVLCDLETPELLALVRQLRERRDRAQALSRQRRRGAQAQGRMAGADAGNQEKKAVLAAAVKRANRELERRRSLARRVSKAEAADAARAHLRQALKRRNAQQAWRGPEDKTPDLGMTPLPNRKIAPSDALHAEGARAALHRAMGDR